MTSYFYHLNFELYPTPEPTSKAAATPERRRDFWLPFEETDIFDDLPGQSRSERRTEHTQHRQLDSRSPSVRAWDQASSSRLTSSPDPNVIGCGTPRAPTTETGRTIERISGKKSLERTKSYPPPSSSAVLRPETAVNDWRFGKVSIETVDLNMAGESSSRGPSAAPSLGPSLGAPGLPNKAACIPLETKKTDVGWGVVHFYREGEETPHLGTIEDSEEEDTEGGPSTSLDCTTVCIPSVPAYMSPGDFVGFMGNHWMNDISHCRMVMTEKMNKYLVLLKFRDSDRAKRWRREFDGKVFNSMEPRVCHVVFIRKITFKTQSQTSSGHAGGSSSAILNTMKPFPPPTPSLVELPTCPVCLERMDDTNGLMTIPCSHVFHCSCLQNWTGSGCPVCRFTNTAMEEEGDPSNPYSQPFGSSVSNLCSVCDCTDDLWICLICGHVGCGRYKGGHAKDHWKETAHSFSLELETQHVWDYAGDMWVHRLIRDKGDGKVTELPSRNDGQRQQHDEDMVPRAKLEDMGLEYMHLLTSQLESQRAYYEELIRKTVDKASSASATAESAASQASAAMEKLNLLEGQYKTLSEETVPQLERDLERERNKATKSQDLARKLGNSVQEEKRINEGLMKRVEHLNTGDQDVRKQLDELKTENAELKEMNRDLSMFISGQEKLKEMENEGNLEEGEIEGGSASVPDKKGKRRAKKK